MLPYLLISICVLAPVFTGAEDLAVLEGHTGGTPPAEMMAA